jgi:hypothetical protein
LANKSRLVDVYLNRALDSLGGYVLGGLFLPEPVLFFSLFCLGMSIYCFFSSKATSL